MKSKILSISLFLALLIGVSSCTKEKVQLRVAAYNVEVSRSATAQEIGLMLKAYDLDVVSFSEAPGGNWTQEVGAVMGLEHVVVGKYSTAGHDDKYKTILSRTPLYGSEEIIMVDTLHTATKAMTKVGNQEFAIYSVHFPVASGSQAYIDETTNKIQTLVDYLKVNQPKETSIVMGDFNFNPSHVNKKNMYHEMFVEIGLDNSWNDLGIDVTKQNTYNALKPEDEGNGDVIDHIMYNHSVLNAVEGEIIQLVKPLSDHKPVWAVLENK
jgi:exonuclease III